MGYIYEKRIIRDCQMWRFLIHEVMDYMFQAVHIIVHLTTSM